MNRSTWTLKVTYKMDASECGSVSSSANRADSASAESSVRETFRRMCCQEDVMVRAEQSSHCVPRRCAPGANRGLDKPRCCIWNQVIIWHFLALEVVAGLASKLEVSMYDKERPSIIKARLPSCLKTTKPTRCRCTLTGWASMHCILNANWSMGGKRISTSLSEVTFSPINLCGVCPSKYPVTICTDISRRF